MTLRPRLAAGLPFRYSKLAINTFNCMFKFEKKRASVTFWSTVFPCIKTATKGKSYKIIAIRPTERVIILPYARAKSRNELLLLSLPTQIVTMDKKPIDRSFLLPIGISIFSVLGTIIALLIVYLDKPETAAPVTPTFTSFKYIFLGTETPIPEPDLEMTPSEEVLPEEPEEPIFIDTPQTGFPTFPVTAAPQASTLTGNTPQTPPTVTVGTAVLTVTERYDDTDPLLEYDGAWENQTNVANAYQGTLFVSNTIGSDLIFSFTGQQMIVGYRGAPGLGSLLISLDDEEFQVNQSAGKEWVSPQLPNVEHIVIIIHDSGSSVNLDYINILNSE